MLVLTGADVSVPRRNVVVRTLRKLSISITGYRSTRCFLRMCISLGCGTLSSAPDTSRRRKVAMSVSVAYQAM